MRIYMHCFFIYNDKTLSKNNLLNLATKQQGIILPMLSFHPQYHLQTTTTTLATITTTKELQTNYEKRTMIYRGKKYPIEF